MAVEYLTLRFGDNFKGKKKGSERAIEKLMSPLDKICESFHGVELCSQSDTFQYEAGLEPMRVTKSYLVGKCAVKNVVELGAGYRTTEVIGLWHQQDEEFIEVLRQFYGGVEPHRNVILK
ncbi:MAG: hypothetical protein WCV90_07835 [Candidatus Woesearchaeota archaeon]|jgi:hypothetical protein